MRSTHDIKENQVVIHVEGLEKTFSMMQITDAHVSLIDERDPEELERLRGENYMEQFPNNMLDQAGNQINPTDRFARVVERAEVLSPDLLCLTGDIIHYPTQYAIEFVKNRIEKTGLPVIYTPGNHDWCFTNVPGSHMDRQEGWEKIKALQNDSMECAEYVLHGLQFLVLDNSIYQITPAQLEFMRNGFSRELPTVVLMHIPLSLPTLRSAVMNVYQAPLLMADPDWTLESRRWWGARADLPETLAFRDLLAEARNLVAVFCGHMHFDHMDAISPWAVQYITGPAFSENYRFVTFKPFNPMR
jgi:UDP-2,3-diacylglucosamine pyrophosphatase LpxH